MLKQGLTIKKRYRLLQYITGSLQVRQEMFSGISGNCYTMQFYVTLGKVLHIFPIRAIIVEPAPLNSSASLLMLQL